MYKLEYLPQARQDMVDIVRYISCVLGNPAAASKLATELIHSADGLTDFPYAYPVYVPIKPLQYEYRKLPVKNYFLFYRVEEETKTITMMRVIYARRDYGKLME